MYKIERPYHISKESGVVEELLQCSVCLYVPEHRIYQCKVCFVAKS